MDVTAAMLVEGRRQARLSEASFKNAGARGWKAPRHLTLGTLPVPGDGGLVSGKSSGKLWIEQLKIAFTSSGSSVCGRSNRPIRKKVIGHTGRYLRNALTGQSVFLHLLRGSRCSISQRASIAAEFSSIHWSRRPPISLRRLAAWLRRESS